MEKAKWAVSNEGQDGGVEKKTPIEYEPATDGGIKPGRASETLPRGTKLQYHKRSGFCQSKNHQFANCRGQSGRK